MPPPRNRIPWRSDKETANSRLVSYQKAGDVRGNCRVPGRKTRPVVRPTAHRLRAQMENSRVQINNINLEGASDWKKRRSSRWNSAWNTKRNNASFFLIAAIKLNKRFISICLASESPLANFRVAASLLERGDYIWRWGICGSLATQPAGHITRYILLGSHRKKHYWKK